ncbi:TPA: hypothetical protein ACHYPN_002507 [Yersinia enterocolitica]|uniref:hypothetical protein n=1 Tax=Yersinia enterocolitica TaxID=630 RepID=UPI0005E3FA7E|nr:hypothetical protein [Yersinia enterocolitica]EKN3386173.1 hypothetical protein [Yersinia enterocolitica]EKN3735285.1 hypothetical protein [Yersinia enterocolitica]EKN3766702.1 hypothetical protein [Yersinia enterocolitica]EKN4081641.1 hypothetical protein [Yersinia enterocolitica]EKN4723969.1 hypothetical protein [Yersinia enterocolitica]
MKKPFDNFTVERLEEIIAEEGYSAIRTPKNDEVRALARIALAARRAEPDWYVVITSVGVWQARYKTRSEAESHIKPWHKDFWIKELYTTPQLNSPEISEGWPTEDMVIAGFESKAFDALIAAVVEHQGWPYSCRESAECVTGIFKAMLAAAPESNHD